MTSFRRSGWNCSGNPNQSREPIIQNPLHSIPFIQISSTDDVCVEPALLKRLQEPIELLHMCVLLLVTSKNLERIEEIASDGPLLH